MVLRTHTDRNEIWYQVLMYRTVPDTVQPNLDDSKKS